MEKDKPVKTAVKRAASAMAVSMLCGAAAIVAVTAMCALFTAKFGSSETTIAVMTGFSAAVGAFTAGYLYARSRKSKGWLMGLICGGAFIAVFALCSLAAKDYIPSGAMLIKAAVIAAAAMAGGISAVNKRPKRIKI